jgi:RNase P subunit RPR2
MPTVCSGCGAEGARGKTVRIRKDGPKFFRSCESCGIEERVWMEG